MSLLDTIIGSAPKAYDPEDDGLAKVDPLEGRSAPFAARRNTQRYVVVKEELSGVAAEVYGTRRLLVIIIALLIANKVIDVSVLASFVSP